MATDTDRKDLERFIEERDYFSFILDAIEGSDDEEDILQENVLRVMINAKNRIIDCALNNKPFIAAYFCNAPELFSAMDIPWYMLMETAFLNSSAPHILGEIDKSVEMGLGTDLCTAIRLSIYYVEAELNPPPTCIVNLLFPCDGAPMMSQVFKKHKAWAHIPNFGADPPYHSDERSIEYFSGELRRMVSFIGEHTGHKLDIDRLREVCDESNKAYALWSDYNELRRAVPSPHGWSIGGSQFFAMTQCFQAGDRLGTEWCRQLYTLTEKKVKEKQGVEGVTEKIRLFWFDIMPVSWCFELFPWLEQEFGAVVVMNMFGNFPYKLIDTSTEETMFHDLAERNLCHEPMIRQARGTAENFVNDIHRIVKDYKIDVVIWPGHMGHKDGSATTHLMGAVCRERGVPFLHLGLDLFDERYTSVEEVKDKMAQFFYAMGLA